MSFLFLQPWLDKRRRNAGDSTIEMRNLIGKNKNRRIPRLRALAITVIVLAGWVSGARAEGNNVLKATLDNGLRVVIVRNTLAPVVTTEMNYLVGADEDLPGFRGMAHAHEHMMFRGSPGLSEDQLAALISAMGGYFNADTQQTVTQYFFTIPATDIEVPLRIEALRMKGILATSALWGKERGAIEQEVARDFSDPEYVFYSKMRLKMFAGTPYRHDPLGSFKSFNRLTAAMIGKFHDSWYVPNNAILVIVGDVDPAGTLEKVKTVFGHITRRKVPKRPAVRLKPLRAGTKTMRLTSDLPYGEVYVSYRLPGSDSPDFAVGQILADVLDSKRADLYALVPQGKALSADFEIEQLPRASIGIATASFPKGGKGGALLDDVKAVLSGYLEKGLPEDLVEASKRHEIADAEFGKNSVSGLASIWSRALAVEGRNSPEDDIELIRKVTVQDVDRVAREYLSNDTAITAILIPTRSGKVSAGHGGARGGESFISKKVKHVTLPEWSKKVFALPKLPVSTVHPVVTILPNGLRLIVQPESISNTVNLYGIVKGNPDLNEPKGKEGVDRVLGGIFPYGAGKLDRLGLQKALDNIAANESAGASFSLGVLGKYFDQGVGILAENLLHPALGEGPFKIVRKQTADMLEGLLQNPSYLSKRALYSGLYPEGDPKLRQATPETAAALGLSDVKSYYEKTFRPDMTTIVVIGNITPERAKAVIKKYFGLWKAEGPKPVTDLPRVPLNKAALAVVPDTSRVQDDVTLAETLGITRKSPDYYALDLGSRVLAGGFYASRLYKDLREETGLVYTVQTIIDANNTRSVFGVLYGCDPSNVSKAKAIIKRDLQEMREAPVREDELQQTKALVLRRLQVSEASMANIGQNLLNLTVLGLPLDEPERAARLYVRMTGEQVMQAFVKWIRPDDFVQVTLGPNPK